MRKTFWLRIVQGVLILLAPVFLTAAATRVTTGHWFVRWEYGKAGFPPDPYGLSMPERTHLAEVCVDYLATNAPLSLLADLRLPDGRQAFNARELRHMYDVQVVYHYLMIAGAVAALLVIGGSAAMRAPRVLVGGGALTLAILAAVGATMALKWDDFFTTFHRIFFTGDTWLFDYSDTLIRLFPMRFWMDVAVTIVAGVIVGAGALILAGALWRGRRPQREGDG